MLIKISNYAKKYPHRVLFYTLMLLAVSFTILWCIIYEGNPFLSILFHDPSDTFMDFYNSIYHTYLAIPYERGCIYPPFAYLLYTVFQKIVPLDIVSEGQFAIKNNQMGQMTFIIYIVITIVTLAYMIYINKKGEKIEKFLLLFILLFSTPILFTLERGNIVILTLIFLMIYVFYYDSENKILREIALIALAMAVATKIYPAVFGLLLLRDKKIKEAIRCVLYGIIIFFGPFLFFGGLKNVPLMFNNIFSTASGFAINGLGYKVNIGNTIAAAAKLFGLEGQVDLLIQVAPYVLLLISVPAAFFIKDRWKSVGILAAILAIVPDFSYVYTLIFLIIPLVMFLNKEKKEKLDILYALCFVAMFAPFVFGLGRIFAPSGAIGYAYSLGTFMESMGLLLLIVLLDINGLMDMLKWRKKYVNSRGNSGKI